MGNLISLWTKVKVNNEIALCEAYCSETKEQIKKAFMKNGISFYIKYKRLWIGKEELVMTKATDDVPASQKHDCKELYYYVICVNENQREKAKHAIMNNVSHADENVLFYEKTDKLNTMHNWKSCIKRSVIFKTTGF